MKRKKEILSNLSSEEYEKRLKKIILGSLGRAWMFWPVRLAVKRRCKDPNKPGWSICEICHTSVERLDVDHIIPCIKPSDGFKTWDEYILRRFVFDEKLLQGICRACHKEKSKKENKERQKQRKLSKLMCKHDDPTWCTNQCPKRKKK